MFVCQNHGVRSGLFFSQLENRDVFVSCTVRNNAVELTVSAFLELNDVDKLMTLANLEQVYACNYFVPTNTLGVELLSRTVTLTRSDLNSMIEMWLSEMTERYTTVSSREYVEAYIEDQEDMAGASEPDCHKSQAERFAQQHGPYKAAISSDPKRPASRSQVSAGLQDAGWSCFSDSRESVCFV